MMLFNIIKSLVIGLLSAIVFFSIADMFKENSNKYEVFHYKKTYPDGSQNDMICIFNKLSGDYIVNILD